jgi:hypothetical protein
MARYQGTYDELAREVPEGYQDLVAKARGGSLKAATALKCLDCSCWQPNEVRQCVVTSCPLYPHRPDKPTEERTPICRRPERDGAIL